MSPSVDLSQVNLSSAALLSPLTSAMFLTRQFSANPEVHYQDAPHFRLMSQVAKDAVEGRGSRFNIVNIANRHGKSLLMSEWVPTWFLLNWPHKRVMVISHTDEKAMEFGRHIKNNIEQAHSLGITPVNISEDSKA